MKQQERIPRVEDSRSVIPEGFEGNRKRDKSTRQRKTPGIGSEDTLMRKRTTAIGELLEKNSVCIFCPVRKEKGILKKLTKLSAIDPFANSGMEGFIWEGFTYAKELSQNLPTNWPLKYSQMPTSANHHVQYLVVAESNQRKK